MSAKTPPRPMNAFMLFGKKRRKDLHAENPTLNTSAISVMYAHFMMTSSNGNIFRVPGPGEFPAQRPVTRSFDVFFDLRLNKRFE